MSEPLTVDQAAKELGYHPKHLYRLLRDGRLHGKRFGFVWMIDRSEVERVKAMQDRHGRLPLRKPKTHE